MLKLTENQLALLRQGVAGPEGRIDPSREREKPSAALSAVLGALKRKGLAVKDEDGQWRVTAAGREAAGNPPEDLSPPDMPAAGMSAPDGLAPEGPASEGPAPGVPAPGVPAPGVPANENSEPGTSHAIDPGTKRGQVLALLQQEPGATMAGMMAATGWQAHSVRALVSGLRKGGMTVLCEKQPGEASRYSIKTAGEGTI